MASLARHLSNDNFCNRPWPSLQLFLPLSLSYSKKDLRYYEFETLFLRSFVLFWPLQISNTSLKVVVNSESVTSTSYVELLGTISGYQSIVSGGISISQSNPSEYYKRGYDRQQLVMLWADNFTSSEFVGFVDSDTVFLTYVDREDLFEDNKPVINGRSGPHDQEDIWAYASAATFRTLGLLEPMRCMSYFPVIIRTRHLREIREYITSHYNNRTKRHQYYYHNNTTTNTSRSKGEEKYVGKKSFNEIFLELSSNFRFMQFNIMCTYLFQFHRDEYVWYVHPMVPSNWTGDDPPANLGQVRGFQNFFTDSNMFTPKPRIATHARYRSYSDRYMGNIIKHRDHMNVLLQAGVCMSPPFPRSESVCKNGIVFPKKDILCGNKTWPPKEVVSVADGIMTCSSGIKPLSQLGYYEEMHIFEYFDFTAPHLNSALSLREQYLKRYERIKNCTHQWSKDELAVIMKPLAEMKDGGWS